MSIHNKLTKQNREVEKSQSTKFGRVNFRSVNLANRLAQDTKNLHAVAVVYNVSLIKVSAPRNHFSPFESRSS